MRILIPPNNSFNKKSFLTLLFRGHLRLSHTSPSEQLINYHFLDRKVLNYILIFYLHSYHRNWKNFYGKSVIYLVLFSGSVSFVCSRRLSFYGSTFPLFAQLCSHSMLEHLYETYNILKACQFWVEFLLVCIIFSETTTHLTDSGLLEIMRKHKNHCHLRSNWLFSCSSCLWRNSISRKRYVAWVLSNLGIWMVK